MHQNFVLFHSVFVWSSFCHDWFQAEPKKNDRLLPGWKCCLCMRPLIRLTTGWWMIKQADERKHYSDVIMSAMASQITGVSIVCSTVSSRADHRNIKAVHHWPLRGIHQTQVNSPHKGPVKRKMFPFDDVIMGSLLQLMVTDVIVIMLGHSIYATWVLIQYEDVILPV